MADVGREVLRELYAEPPERFVAARDAAVAAARAEGDRALATAIGRLRKPTVGAWLVNLLAWHAPDDLAALYAVGDELRAAQRDLRGGDLRELSARRRSVVADLVARSRELAARARPGDAALPWDEVTASLNAVLSDVDTAEQVRQGRLVRTTAYAGFGEPDVAWAAAPAAPPRNPARDADRPKRAAAREAERTAQAELRAARRDEERARGAYDDAAGAEDAARARLADVEAALAELRERKATAQAELNDRRAERQAAQRALTAATRRLQRARDRLPD